MTPEPGPAPLPDPLLSPSRHSVPDATAVGSPTILTDRDYIAEVDDRVSDLNHRVRRAHAVALIGFIVVALMFAGMAFIIDSGNARQSQDEQQQTAADAERARVDRVHTDGICVSLSSLRDVADRLSYPNDVAAYTRLSETIVAVARRVGCP
jgi:hypothetical protein